MQIKNSVIMAFIILSLMACQTEQKINIKPYYFPINELIEGKVYEFRAVDNNSVAPEYWYYKTLETDTATYLTGTFYNGQLVIEQVFGEEIVSNGTSMEQYILYDTDTSGLQQPINVNIEMGNVMPFSIKDTLGIFLFKINWENQVLSPDSSTLVNRKTTLIRNRRYKGKDTIEIEGKVKECVVFEVNEVIETEEEGFQELRIHGEEMYAKGIGLVYYRKEINPEFKIEYKLYDRFSMSKLIEQSGLQELNN